MALQPFGHFRCVLATHRVLDPLFSPEIFTEIISRQKMVVNALLRAYAYTQAALGLTMRKFYANCSLLHVSKQKCRTASNITVSIHCAPEMSEIDCIGRIESFWPKFVRGW